MSDETVLITGVPGLIGSGLLERLVETRDLDTEFVCLVESRYRALSRRFIDTLGDDSHRVMIVTGDITYPYLRLGSDYVDLTDRVTEIFHLAAVYTLGVDADVAERVNVDGTEHVLDFATRCDRLDRFHHMSTCYVSGRHDGLFTEDDVIDEPDFNNAYERSKHAAEAMVRRRATEGLDVTIYRPSIVVGDSDTGFTTKYDGLYFLLQLLDAQPDIAVFPRIGDPRAVEFNVVPRDFVVDAIAHISKQAESVNQTYHLCDPHPPTVKKLVTESGWAMGRAVVFIPTPRRLLELEIALMRYFGLTSIDPAALAYVDLPTSYATANTRRALQGTPIEVPPVTGYVGRLAKFMRAHPTPPSVALYTDSR